MALINKKIVADRETASYKLDRATVELVRLYAEFIGSPQEHVVNEALVYLFRKDREFYAWLKSAGHEMLLASAVRNRTRVKGHFAPESAGTEVANGNGR